MADFGTSVAYQFGSVIVTYTTLLPSLAAAGQTQGAVGYIFDSSLNQDVVLSFDGGVTDHFTLRAGKSLTLDLGRCSHSGIVSVKYRTAAPTSGEILATMWGI